MSEPIRPRVCPVEKSGSFDNGFRRTLQNPRQILKPFIREGMKVMDLGCGPGFFTMEIARMVGSNGKVIAADLQQGMLSQIRRKIQGTEFENLISLHQCKSDSIGLDARVDFILAMYMVHEVPNQLKLFKEFRTLLHRDGKVLIIEPLFHVNRKAFNAMVDHLKRTGFEVTARPRVFFSRAVLMTVLP